MNGMRTLNHREQAREKLPVYYGSYDNFLHPVRECIINARDVLKNNPNGKIEVFLHEDNKTITIKDNGLGIPINGYTDGKPNWELVFLTLFSGTKMEADSDDGGTNGVGLCVLTYTSLFINVISKREGNIYSISFKNGGEINNPFSNIGKTEETGTEITFQLSEDIYANTVFNHTDIEKILERVCAVSPNVLGVFNYKEKSIEFKYDSIISYSDKYINKQIDDIVIPMKGFTTNYINTKREEKTETTSIEILINCSEDIIQESYLNGIYLPNYQDCTIHQGVIDGFKNAFNKFIDENKLYQNKEKKITNKDIEESISFIANILSTNVSYEAQTKFATKKELYKTLIKQYIIDYLEVYFIENKVNSLTLANKILINKRARENADKTRQNVKKKLEEASNMNRVKIQGLTDCNMKKSEVKDRWLLVVEGLSAKSTVVESYDNSCMGALGLKGRFISSLKKSVDDVLNNVPAYTLIQALGCGIEIPSEERKHFKDIKSFNKDNLRYGNLAILTDADCWGSGIRLALLTFCYRYLPTLLKENRVYIIISPRYEIKMKNGQIEYLYNDREKEEFMKKVNEKDIAHIGIVKGIGEIDKDDFWDKVLKPEVRDKTFIQVNYDECDEIVSKYFEDYMGNDTEPRKDFVKEFITKVNLEEIN